MMMVMTHLIGHVVVIEVIGICAGVDPWVVGVHQGVHGE